MPETYKQNIQVIIDHIIKGQEKIAKATAMYHQMGGQYKNVTESTVANAMKQRQALDMVQRKQQFLSEWSQKLGVNGSRVKQIMADQNIVFDRMGNVVTLAGEKVKDLNGAMQRGKIATKRFQMQWLSLLFFGMAIQRTFTGLIKTSMDWVGITELMTTTLGVIFLPVALQLLEILLPIMSFFMNLPEPVKQVIGWIVIAGAAFGFVLSAIGQLALGLAGINWLVGTNGILSMGNAATTASGKVGTLTSKLKGLAGVASVAIGITLVISGMKEEAVNTALMKIFGGALAIGIGALLLGASVPAAIFLGALAAIIALEIKFNIFEKAGDAINGFFATVKERIQRAAKGVGSVGEIFTGEKQKPTDVMYDTHFGVAATREEIQRMYNREQAGYDPFTGNKTVTNATQSVSDALISPGGNIITTDPADYLIATKNPESLTGQSINMNVTYNVTVSDKKEFETMLERNNRSLLNETRRIVKI